MDPERQRNIKGRKIKIFSSKDILKNISVVGINTIIIAALNIIFQIVMSRRLGPELYGELATLLVINSAILLVVASVGFIITRFISYYKTRQQYDKMKYLAQWSFVFFFFMGMIIFAIINLTSRATAQYLNIGDATLINIFGVLVWVSFMIPIIEGILRGLQEFDFMGKYKLLEALLRLIICSALVFLGMTLKPVLIGLVIASALTIIFSGYIMKKIYIAKPYKIVTKDIYIYAVPVFIGCIALAIVLNADLILAKHFLGPVDVGVFATAGLLAKIVFSIAFGSVSVMFPKVVEENSNGLNTIETLKNTMKLLLMLGGAITILIAAFPTFWTKLLFGSVYSSGSFLSAYAFAIFFFSISLIFIFYELAIKRYESVFFAIIAAVVVIYQISNVHSGMYEIVWALFIIDFLLMAVMTYRNRKIFVRTQD